MNRRLAPRFLLLLGLSVGGALVAIVAGLPLLALLLSPLLVLSLAGGLLHRWPDLELSVEVPERMVEGDTANIVISASSAVGIPWLLLDLELPPELEPEAGTARTIITIPPGQMARVQVAVTATRWGLSRPGQLRAIARDRFGLFISSRVHNPNSAVRVHPPEGPRRTVLVPPRLRPRAGNHQAPTFGDGSTFAEVRPYRIGDSRRSLNWRVSARRREPWVTSRHPDRSGDLVLVVDSFRDIGPLGDRLVQRMVRGALGLAESSLGQYDRVGLLDVGRSIRWYQPRLGRLHEARLIDALLDTQVEPGLRAPSVNQLPLHDLSTDMLVVFLTGLLDEEAARLPTELRSRGFQVVAIECSPDPYLLVESTATERSARLWRLQRAAIRRRMTERGVGVVQWRHGDPLEIPVAALGRRRAVGARR